LFTGLRILLYIHELRLFFPSPTVHEHFSSKAFLAHNNTITALATDSRTPKKLNLSIKGLETEQHSHHNVEDMNGRK
jgi:hypothetical protein